MKKFTKQALREEMNRRKVKVPALSEATGIPKDRIYAWYRDNTTPKREDQDILEKWLNEVPFKKNEEIADGLPIGNLTITLEDYVREIKDQNKFLQSLLLENVMKLDTNLSKALGGVVQLSLHVESAREVVLESLTRLERKPKGELAAEADKIVRRLMKEQNKRGTHDDRRM